MLMHIIPDDLIYCRYLYNFSGYPSFMVSIMNLLHIYVDVEMILVLLPRFLQDGGLLQIGEGVGALAVLIVLLVAPETGIHREHGDWTPG